MFSDLAFFPRVPASPALVIKVIWLHGVGPLIPPLDPLRVSLRVFTEQFHVPYFLVVYISNSTTTGWHCEHLFTHVKFHVFAQQKMVHMIF